MKKIDLLAPLTLNDIAAALPGIFLVIGYLLGTILSQFEPSTAVTIEEQSALSSRRVLVVPRSRLTDYRPIDRDSAELVDSVEFKVPQPSSTGLPQLKLVERSYSGRGRPRVSQNPREVLVPVFGMPSVRSFVDTVLVQDQWPGGQERWAWKERRVFEPNVTWRGTGVYEDVKSVTFDTSVDPERIALFGALLGSALSVVYLFPAMVLKALRDAK